MPQARPPKAFMAVEGAGMSLDDDTPIEWSCYSSPYSTQRSKPQQQLHQQQQQQQALHHQHAWVDERQLMIKRKKIPTNRVTRDTNCDPVSPATPLPSQAGTRRPPPSTGLGAVGADTLAAIRASKRCRATATSFPWKGDGGVPDNIGTGAGSGIVSVGGSSPGNVPQNGLRTSAKSAECTNSSGEGIVQFNGEVELRNDAALATGSTGIFVDRGAASSCVSGLESGLGAANRGSAEPSVSAMDVVGGGGETTRWKHRRQWEPDEGGSSDDLHILYGSPS